MAASPERGQPVADFTLPGGVLTDGVFDRRDFTLSEHRGHPLVLAFYPGDDTSVCTKQLCAYSSGLDAFTDCGAQVWGISPQGVDSHEAFARKHGLRMPLLADVDMAVTRAFGVTMPGLGVRRSVFIIAADGTLHWKHIAVIGATFRSTKTLTQQLAALG